MNIKKKAVLFLATGCSVGKIPTAPGTFGTLAGLPLCLFLSKLELGAAAVITLLFILFSAVVARQAESMLKKKDPGCIVIDEIAGIMVALFGLPFDVFTVASGFVLFRILDIFKPFPVGYVDRSISGGAGVVMDDVAAGIMANVALRLIYLL